MKDHQIHKMKDFGAFYTPSHLAYSVTEAALNHYITRHINILTSSTFLALEEILNTTNLEILKILNDILGEIRILDGAVGDGEFLRACFTIIKSIKEKVEQRLSETQVVSSEMTSNILSYVLYGMDIDPEAVVNCHKKLRMFLPDSEKALRNNIIRGDFLESTLTTWKNFPPTREGFDIIIGNPPWGGKLTKNQREHYHNQFQLKSPKRNLNTFSLFIYQAAKLLAPNRGILAYLLPKNVVRSNQYTYLREFLVKNFQILAIDFHGLFQDVTQEFILLIGLYGKEVPSDHTILIDGEIQIPQTSYLTNIDYIFTREFNSQSQRLIQLIHENSRPLNQFITIKRGEELSKRGGIMHCPYCAEWVPVSSRKTRIVCPQCHKALQRQNLQINFLIEREADGLHTQPILTGDDFDPFSIKTTHFIDPLFQFRSKKDPMIYTSPKLVIQKIKRVPCAAFDPENHWTTQNVYNLRLKPPYENNSKILYFILAVLNSSLFQWYYEYQFNIGSKYTNAISIRNLSRLPLKEPDIDNPLFHRIVDIAEELSTELNKKTLLIKELNKLILKYYNCENIPLPAL